MKMRKIENPCWKGAIKEILIQYPHAFTIRAIDDQPLDDSFEWWECVDRNENVLGVIFYKYHIITDEFEIEIARNLKYADIKGVGTYMLEHIESEIFNKGGNTILSLVNKDNNEHDSVVSWFINRGYEVIKEQSKRAFTCLNKFKQ